MSDDPIIPSSLDRVAAGDKPPHHGPPVLPWLIPLLVLVGGVALLWFLKGKTPDPAPPAATPVPTPVAIATEDPALREKAEALLEGVLMQRRHWEERGAVYWAGGTWSNALGAVSQGDAAFVEKRYADSLAAYRKALAQLKTLEAREEAAIPGLLAETREYYAAGEQEEAAARLEALLVLDPEHGEVKGLVPRVRICDQTFSRLERGREAMAQGKWAEAFVELEAATQLDPAFPGLAGIREEVRKTLAEEEFQKWISDGLLALDHGELDSAEALLRKAADFRAGDPAVLDALQQVAEAKLARKVAAALEKASALETGENLQEAYEAYLAVLQLDSEVAVAEQGKDRVAGFLALEDKLRKFEGSWWSADTKTFVDDLRARSPSALPSGLARRVDLFVATWTRAHSPRTVEFTSDGTCQVQLQGQSAWQPFERKRVELKPGRYVIKAWARGFVDVRETVSIPLDGEVPVFDVRVREAL